MGSHCRESDPKILDTLPSRELYQTLENVYCQVSNHTEPSRFKNNSLASLFLLYETPFLVVNRKLLPSSCCLLLQGVLKGKRVLRMS